MRDVHRTRSQGPDWSTVTQERFARAVAALPAASRAVFELQAFERQPYDQIATRLCISRDAVGPHLCEARALLAAALLQPGPG